MQGMGSQKTDAENEKTAAEKNSASRELEAVRAAGGEDLRNPGLESAEPGEWETGRAEPESRRDPGLESAEPGEWKTGRAKPESHRDPDLKSAETGERPAEAGYFPLFIDLWKKKVLVAGAGKVAERRVRVLLAFGADVTVAAPMTEQEKRNFLDRVGVLRTGGERSHSLYDRPEFSSGESEADGRTESSPSGGGNSIPAEARQGKEGCGVYGYPSAAGSLHIHSGSYEPGLCRGAFLVLAATDDRELNARICRDGKREGAFVNNASDRRQCDFYFPSVVRDRGRVVGISGGGEDHAAVKRLREKIEWVLMEDSAGEAE